MSIASTIDSQIVTFQQLLKQHENTRRENQQTLVQPLTMLNDDVKRCVVADKRAYENAKQTFYTKFNFFARLFFRAAAQYKNYSVHPLKCIYYRRNDLSLKVNDLLNETMNEIAPIETRTYWNGSIAVVYNPITGRAEWKKCWHGGIHGVFNPLTRTIEWQSENQSGIYGVFNPKLNIVEWKKYYKGGVHGVYNPSTASVEWQMSFDSGVGGVYNPITEKVEWRTAYRGGIVGYFDYEYETVKWIDKWHHGIALIRWDQKLNTYLTTSSCGWYGDE